jgi:hypothetical protein
VRSTSAESSPEIVDIAAARIAATADRQADRHVLVMNVGKT